MLPNAPFMPMEQWTPEYAAQILSIAQQAQSQAPDVPGMGQPGIVPMGAPGSLNPPPVAPKPEAVDVPEAGPAMPKGGGGWQAMMPLLAAQFYGSNPRTAHMVPMVAQMAQQQRQQMGQRQLADIRGNIAKVAEKGPDALKKYLTEAVTAPDLHPEVSKVVADQLKQVTERTNARDAVAKLTSRDPKEIMAALPQLMETLGDERALALYKGLKQENKPQVVQAGDQIWTFDPATREYSEGPKTTPKFNAATVGGTDVTQELTRMGINPQEATSEQLQQAAQNVQTREESERAKGRASHERAILGGAELQAKAHERSTIKAAEISAQREQEVLPREAAQQLADMKTSHALLTDIENAYNPAYTGPVAGPWGKVKSYAGWASPEEVAQRTKVVASMNAKLKTDSGLAVTPNELQRKIEELPQVNDPPETFVPKLKATKDWIANSYKDRHQFYTNPRSALPGQLSDDTAKGTKIDAPKLSPKGRVIQR